MAATAARRPSRAERVDFGYRRVGAAEKPSLVGAVFAKVAPRYDLMNDLMSGGMHRLWKASLLAQVKPRPGVRLLDVGGGTGDVSIGFVQKGGTEAIVLDPSRAMVEVGRDRAMDRGVMSGITWLVGDAEDLPLATSSVDTWVAAFSVRNMTRIDRALAEARRVLKPGGRFLCLEFAPTAYPLFKPLYDAYSFRVLPALGELVAGDRDAYQYLAESIRRFPAPDAFAGMIEDAGLAQVGFRSLTGGVASIHAAWRV